MKIIIILLAGFMFSACTRTESGLMLDAPDYEHRDIEVNNLDLDVLQKADALLSSEEHWSKDPSMKCHDVLQPGMPGFVDGHDVMASKISLYCALELACVETIGSYMHRLPALQEVRFTIADNYPMRWKVHYLADFNANPQTTFSDVKNVLYITIARVKQKLERYQAEKGKR